VADVVKPISGAYRLQELEKQVSRWKGITPRVFSSIWEVGEVMNKEWGGVTHNITKMTKAYHLSYNTTTRMLDRFNPTW